MQLPETMIWIRDGTTTVQKPFVHSFTGFNDYENCPKKFYHKQIARDHTDKYTKTSQQLGGTRIHEAVRRRIKLREPLPPDMAQYEHTCATIEAHESVKHLELKLGMRADGQSCDFNDPDVRLRGALDIAMLNSPAAVILDLKSGKPWEDPLELRIQALLLQSRYPDLTQIVGAYIWLRDDGRVGPLYQMDTSKTWEDVCSRAAAIHRRVESNDWPPDENKLCAWCPVPKTVCEFRRDP